MKKKSATMAVEPLESPAMQPFEKLGKGFVALGNALQDEKSNVSKLSDLAFEVGLKLEFRLDEREAKATSWAEIASNLTNEIDTLKEKLASQMNELALIKALTGVHRAEWTGLTLEIDHVCGAPYGTPFPLQQVKE